MKQKVSNENKNEFTVDEYRQSLMSFLQALRDYNEQTDLKSLIISVYKKNKRHKYSVITSYIYRKNIIPNQESISEYLVQICDNLHYYIDEKLETDFKDKQQDELSVDDYKERLEKLHDHISLESIRFDYSKGIEQNIQHSAKQIQEDIENKHKIIQEDINKQKNQHIVILGIFASIVLAFVGGMIFSGSVFSNIHKVGIHKLTFVMCFVALFFGNILFALFKFIRDINGTDIKDNKFFWMFNLFFIAVIIVDVVYFFDKFSNETLFIFLESK